MKQVFQVSDFQAYDNFFDVEWIDGHRSHYHYIWLRDNCRCCKCSGPGGQKFINVFDIPLNIKPTQLNLSDIGSFVLSWDDGHISEFDLFWLRQHCYSTEERDKRRHKPILWDSSLQDDLPSVEHASILSTDAGLLVLLEKTRDYGFCMVSGMANAIGEAERLGEMIGPLRENNYGRVFDVQFGVGPEIAATQNYEIMSHCDDIFRYTPPCLTVFHCITNSVDNGGETWLTDTFSIAETLRMEDPSAFDLLSRMPQMYRRLHEDEADLRSEGRVISLDFLGNVVGVRFSTSTSAPLDLPFNLVEPYYAALRKFLMLGLEKKFQIKFKLHAGDCVVFDNHRVTHARSAFSGGSRHMQLVHLERDEFHSKLRVLGCRLKREDTDLVLGRGAFT